MAEAMPFPPETGWPLVYAPLDDLHTTDAKARNYPDFLAMLVQLEVDCNGQPNFLHLPGNVAGNSRLAQYRLVAAALRIASMPPYVIMGDHDMEPCSLAHFHTLAPFYTLTPANALPVEVRDVQRIFLDFCGSGWGSSDFRIGAAQFEWLREQLNQVPVGAEVAPFMPLGRK